MSSAWTDVRLFNRLMALGQPRLVEALRRLSAERGANLLVASEWVVSDDPEVAAQVRMFVERHG